MDTKSTFSEIKVFWKKVNNLRNVQHKLDCDDIKMKARNNWNVAPFKQKCRYKNWDKIISASIKRQMKICIKDKEEEEQQKLKYGLQKDVYYVRDWNQAAYVPFSM